MRAYRGLLVLLALAVLAGLAAWAIGSDPGYVLVRRGSLAIETTLVFAVLAGLAVAVLARIVWLLLRWPLRAAAARARRRGRLQFAEASLALVEGHAPRAEKRFAAAAGLRSLRTAALLGAWRASRARGDTARQGQWLARLAGEPGGDVAATLLRAGGELEDGRAGTVIELLTPLDQAQRLPPAGARLLGDALVARGRAREALPLAQRLRKAQAMSPSAMETLEAAWTAAALMQAGDGPTLRGLWGELPRDTRRLPTVAVAYAERSAALRLGDGAAAELEALIEREWSEPLVVAWSDVPTTDRGTRLRAAERWLAAHPASAGALLALGRLCRHEQLWAKSEDYLRRALAAGATAASWEELGHLYAAQADPARASVAYANALAATRGAGPAPLVARGRDELVSTYPAREERDAHGVPRLPGPA